MMPLSIGGWAVLRLVLAFSIILGASAMAKDGTVQAPKGKAAPIDQDEEAFKTPRGQDIERLFNEFTSGKKTFEQAADEYEKKWGGQPVERPTAQAPAAPFDPFGFAKPQ